ncbi:uncharacterized protein LOC129589127 isoform X2 [Paramacrobiotus metropolitanus]|uniref:uncharacterized protein LOC129589127 isoform X2 n=1 Tax=Paramacrobiotus metropolitanus TaxID=2943436 RepID=UPI00244595BC|nr:uncharacterized protein LOC129589127 isoform X2 [Paramacrobiotus metropolitanus]
MDYRCYLYIVRLLTVSNLFHWISAHIVLTYPPARKYALDYLNNVDTPEPCGMPRGLSAPTYLESGTDINVTWSSAYPHLGGYSIDLLDANYDRVSTLVPASLAGREPRANSDVLKWQVAPLNEISRTVSLPKSLRCDNCTLRIVRQALQWNNWTSDSDGFLFRSCADVTILPQIDGTLKCSSHGSWTGTECLCDDLYTGNACQFKEICSRDSDCNFHGRCINIGSNTAPQRRCFCNSGWQGIRCAQGSSVRIRVFNKAYYTHYPLADELHLYWKIDKSAAEMEMVVQSKSTSWVGIGWRPADISADCKDFPRLPNETYWPHGAAVLNHSLDLAARSLDILTYSDNSDALIRPRRQAEELHPMDCTDMVVGIARSSYGQVGDYYTRDRSTPRPDGFYGGMESLSAGIVYEEDGWTTLRFIRTLAALEPTDHAFIPGPMHVVFARGPDASSLKKNPAAYAPTGSPADVGEFYAADQLKYHGSGGNDRGSTVINFFDEHDSSKELGTPCVGEWRTPANCRGSGCRYVAHWEYLEEIDSIYFKIQSRSREKWTGIGFSSVLEHMPNSDVIVGWVDDEGKVQITDRYADGYRAPKVDKKQYLQNIAGSANDAFVTLEFTRPRKTNDSDNFDFWEDNCAYFEFPVDGGRFDKISGVISKHQYIPSVSKTKICIQSCKTVTTTAASTTTTPTSDADQTEESDASGDLMSQIQMGSVEPQLRTGEIFIPEEEVTTELPTTTSTKKTTTTTTKRQTTQKPKPKPKVPVKAAGRALLQPVRRATNPATKVTSTTSTTTTATTPTTTTSMATEEKVDDLVVSPQQDSMDYIDPGQEEQNATSTTLSPTAVPTTVSTTNTVMPTTVSSTTTAPTTTTTVTSTTSTTTTATTHTTTTPTTTTPTTTISTTTTTTMLPTTTAKTIPVTTSTVATPTTTTTASTAKPITTPVPSTPTTLVVTTTESLMMAEESVVRPVILQQVFHDDHKAALYPNISVAVSVNNATTVATAPVTKKPEVVTSTTTPTMTTMPTTTKILTTTPTAALNVTDKRTVAIVVVNTSTTPLTSIITTAQSAAPLMTTPLLTTTSPSSGLTALSTWSKTIAALLSASTKPIVNATLTTTKLSTVTASPGVTKGSDVKTGPTGLGMAFLIKNDSIRTPAPVAVLSSTTTTTVATTTEKRPPVGEGFHSECRGEWRSPPDCPTEKCEYLAMWEFNVSSGEIQFFVQSAHPDRWTGIGFSSNGKMPQSQIIYGYRTGDASVALLQGTAEGYYPPVNDTDQEILHPVGWVKDGLLGLSFRRNKTLDGAFWDDEKLCPYFLFPYTGGSVDSASGRIGKHIQTPVVSANRICMQPCTFLPTVPVTLAPSTTLPTTQPTTVQPTTTTLLPVIEGTPCRAIFSYPRNCNGSDCIYVAQWDYIPDRDEINFLILSNRLNTWTGIGFSDTGEMPYSDMIVGWVGGEGRATITDRWSTGHTEPQRDLQQDISRLGGTVRYGTQMITFTRKRLTLDERDYQFNDTNCPYLIFPVFGGTYDELSEVIDKHQDTPVVSDQRICIRACRKPSNATRNSPFNFLDQKAIFLDPGFVSSITMTSRGITTYSTQSFSTDRTLNFRPINWHTTNYTLRPTAPRRSTKPSPVSNLTYRTKTAGMLDNATFSGGPTTTPSPEEMLQKILAEAGLSGVSVEVVNPPVAVPPPPPRTTVSSPPLLFTSTVRSPNGTVGANLAALATLVLDSKPENVTLSPLASVSPSFTPPPGAVLLSVTSQNTPAFSSPSSPLGTISQPTVPSILVLPPKGSGVMHSEPRQDGPEIKSSDNTVTGVNLQGRAPSEPLAAQIGPLPTTPGCVSADDMFKQILLSMSSSTRPDTATKPSQPPTGTISVTRPSNLPPEFDTSSSVAIPFILPDPSAPPKYTPWTTRGDVFMGSASETIGVRVTAPPTPRSTTRSALDNTTRIAQALTFSENDQGQLGKDPLCGDNFRFPSGCEKEQCLYMATWRPGSNVDEVEFIIETGTPDLWTGIGFGDDRHMVDSDIIYGFIRSTGIPKMVDAYAKDYTAPVKDFSDNIRVIEGGRRGNRAFFHFARKLATGDKYDYEFGRGRCPYFKFPIMGSTFSESMSTGSIAKHRRTPIVSPMKICIASCNAEQLAALRETTTVATTTTTVPTTAAANRSPSVAKTAVLAGTKAAGADGNSSSEKALVCAGEFRYPDGCLEDKCQYVAQWEYLPATDEIKFDIVSADVDKWTGIGFNDKSLMSLADMFYGWVGEDGKGMLIDAKAPEGRQQPVRDMIQDGKNLTARRNERFTQLTFTRRRLTKDKNDFQFTDDACAYLLFPVKGGDFNADALMISKHEAVAQISQKRVCITSQCAAQMSTPDVGKPSEKRMQSDLPAGQNSNATLQPTTTTESTTISIPSYLPCEGTWKYPDNCAEPNCIYVASWNFLDDADAIRFVVKAKAAGWTGIGFNDDMAMKNADAVIGWVTSKNSVVVTDRHCVDNLGAPMDDEQDVFDVAGRKEDGYQVIEFTRKRDTADVNAQDYIFGDQKCPFFIFPVVGGAYDSYGGIQAHSQKALPKISSGRICVRSCSVDVARRMVVTFRIVDRSWTPEMDSRSSAGFKKLEAEVSASMRKLLGSTPGFRGTRVLSMRPGSVVVDVEIVIDPTANQTSTAAAKTMREILVSTVKTRHQLGTSSFTVDPDSLTISNAEQLFMNGVPTASSDTTTVAMGNKAPESEVRTYAIIGGVCGIIVILLLLAFGKVWYDRKSRIQRHRERTRKQSLDAAAAMEVSSRAHSHPHSHSRPGSLQPRQHYGLPQPPYDLVHSEPKRPLRQSSGMISQMSGSLPPPDYFDHQPRKPSKGSVGVVGQRLSAEESERTLTTYSSTDSRKVKKVREAEEEEDEDWGEVEDLRDQRPADFYFMPSQRRWTQVPDKFST